MQRACMCVTYAHRCVRFFMKTQTKPQMIFVEHILRVFFSFLSDTSSFVGYVLRCFIICCRTHLAMPDISSRNRPYCTSRVAVRAELSRFSKNRSFSTEHDVDTAALVISMRGIDTALVDSMDGNGDGEFAKLIQLPSSF